MIKNKDGSYNKFSLLIISLIVIIGVGIVGSTLITESPTIDGMSLAYIGLFISGALTIYYGKKVFFKPKPTITHVMQTSTPPTPSKMEIVEVHSHEPFTVEDEPIIKIEKIKRPREEPTGSGFGLSGLTSMIVTLVIGSITLMVGMVVMNSMIQALPELPSNSPMSSSLTSVTENVGTAFNFAAIGLFVIAAVGMILMLSNVISRDDYL
jgi:nitrate reductase NapE component